MDSPALPEDDWTPAEYVDLDFELTQPGTPRVTRTYRGAEVIEGEIRIFGSKLGAAQRRYSEAEYLTPADMAEIVRLEVQAIRRAINEGQLPAYKLRGQFRTKKTEFQAWVESNRVKPSIHDI